MQQPSALRQQAAQWQARAAQFTPVLLLHRHAAVRVIVPRASDGSH